MRDVFVSYATHDSYSHVHPLVERLNDLAVSCWVDKALIGSGEEVVRSVGKGLRTSRMFVPILTDAYLGRAWTDTEMDAAFNESLTRNTVFIVPVLDVPRERLEHALPLLAGRVHIFWSDGVDSVAQQIAALFKREARKNWAFEYPPGYLGKVWFRCTRQGKAEKRLYLTLRWGSFYRRVRVPDGRGPISFVHHRFIDDNKTLHVEASEPTIVTAGEGAPPDEALNTINIDEGWTRVPGTWDPDSVETHRPPGG